MHAPDDRREVEEAASRASDLERWLAASKPLARCRGDKYVTSDGWISMQPKERRFVILADGAHHVVTRAHYQARRLDDDLVYHDFYTSEHDRVRYSQSDIDRIDELLEGVEQPQGKLLRQPLWPVPGEPAPEAVHGHELPARWRALGSVEMARLADEIGIDTSMLDADDRTTQAIRDLILHEID